MMFMHHCLQIDNNFFSLNKKNPICPSLELPKTKEFHPPILSVKANLDKAIHPLQKTLSASDVEFNI